MRKKIFIFTVILMSVSLFGIISIQGYWVQNAFKNKRQQFNTNVTIALANTCEIIKNNEENNFYRQYQTFFKDDAYRKKATIKSFLFQQIDTAKQQKFTFGSTVLEENFKIPSGFLNNDSIILKRFSGREDYYRSKIIKGGTENKDFSKTTSQDKLTFFKNYPQWEKQQMEDVFSKIKNNKSITQRIQNGQLNSVLKREFLKKNIKLKYQYGLFQNKKLTDLHSANYVIKKDNFKYPIFQDNNGDSPYSLHVSFSGERRYLFSEILSILLLSLLFISIIIVVFSLSLYQLVRQKKIDQMKTDFINNMTHEFKTPIATINLALDAIKNPKVIGDKGEVKRYLEMIKDENKRMNNQVENVLQISRLEKKQQKIPKEPVFMHRVIDKAIEHVKLLISHREGILTTNFNAKATEVIGSTFNLVNVVVNILENAVKYSEGKPEINVTTENRDHFFVLKIKDKGIGMSKNTQKYAFDKFYRAQSGNIHNVKGHGLGLAYVKKIVESHRGTISIKSEKGKGSTFTVKIPLI